MPAGAKQSASSYLPEGRTLPILGKAVQKCHGCDLYRNATHAVFGELETGATAKKPKVTIMMIGEQPGDHEDKEGRPSWDQRKVAGQVSGSCGHGLIPVFMHRAPIETHCLSGGGAFSQYLFF